MASGRVITGKAFSSAVGRRVGNQRGNLVKAPAPPTAPQQTQPPKPASGSLITIPEQGQRPIPGPQSAPQPSPANTFNADDFQRMLAQERAARDAEAARMEAERQRQFDAQQSASNKARQDELALKEKYMSEQAKLQKQALDQQLSQPTVSAGPIHIDAPASVSPAAPAAKKFPIGVVIAGVVIAGLFIFAKKRGK